MHALVLTLTLGLSSLHAEWPDQSASAMGLPPSSDGRLEVRVWLGGGIAHPFRLIRVWETEDGAAGEKLVWTTSKGKRIRRLMNREYCSTALESEGDLAWCRVGLSRHIDWQLFLKDLQPSELWALAPAPHYPERECLVEDGETVAVQVIQGDEYHAVAYSNPEWCCRTPGCAFIDHVRNVVNRLN